MNGKLYLFDLTKVSKTDINRLIDNGYRFNLLSPDAVDVIFDDVEEVLRINGEEDALRK